MTPRQMFLDHQATTPLDARVLHVMLPWMGRAANPHAANAAGRAAGRAVEDARAQVAALIGARLEEVTFTSGATEAINIAIRSVAVPGTRVIASPIEHACVLATLASLPAIEVSTLPIDETGVVAVEDVAEALDADAALVAVMAVNNEIGTVQPVGGIAAACRFADVPYLCDLSQAVGRIAVDVGAAGVSLGALSSHKIYGPQGIGALYHAREMRDRLHPIMTGGGQERELRPGTVPVALAVGFGAACALAAREMDEDARRARRAAEAFMSVVRREAPQARLNGSSSARVPHNLNLSFPDVDADALLASVPSVDAATGSACSAGAIGRSHVLAAIGLDGATVDGAVRIGFGRGTTEEDAATAAMLMTAAANSLREPIRRRRAGTRT